MKATDKFSIILFLAICVSFMTIGIGVGFAIRDYQYRDYVYIDNGKVVTLEKNRSEE